MTISGSPATTPAFVDVATIIGEHGYRMTSPRRAVVQSVLERQRPFTAEQLVATMRDRQPGVGRATVYRTLEILASIHVLTRLLQPGGHPTYVVGQPTHRHHLVCSDCGAIIPFTRCPIDDLVRTLTRDTDFSIHAHTLEVFGTCPACQDDAGRATPEFAAIA